MQHAPASWEEVERAAREFATQGSGSPEARQVPSVYNVAAATGLGAERRLGWDGRWYRVPPVPFRAGAELYALHLELVQIHQGRHKRQRELEEVVEAEVDVEAERADAELEVQLAERCVAVMSTLVRPEGKLRRLLWLLGLGRLPFERATVQEIVQLMDFFYSPPTSTRVVASRPATFQRARRG